MTRTVKIVFRAGAVLQLIDVPADVASELVRVAAQYAKDGEPTHTGSVGQSLIDLREVVAIIVL